MDDICNLKCQPVSHVTLRPVLNQTATKQTESCIAVVLVVVNQMLILSRY